MAVCFIYASLGWLLPAKRGCGQAVIIHFSYDSIKINEHVHKADMNRSCDVI